MEAQLLSHLFNASMACFWKHSAPHSRAERRESANPLAAGGFDLEIVMRSREREGSHDAQNGSDFPSIMQLFVLRSRLIQPDKAEIR